MLDPLFGNKNVQRILLFLFVNGSCYGSQLQRLLNAPLTPVQKALLRLEKGGIIQSQIEGKTKLYRFNPRYPVLQELESLLRKTYTLLSPQEKKHYHCPESHSRFQCLPLSQRKPVIERFWKRLAAVKSMTFQAVSHSNNPSGWDRKGKGDVVVIFEAKEQLVFSERGHWQNPQGERIDFSNIFRWTLDLSSAMISLETLRRGWNHPMFLFHLAPSSQNALGSIDSHLCGNDTYLGKLSWDDHGLKLYCRAIGPSKNEEIDYFYR
jgi:hypothetical protein